MRKEHRERVVQWDRAQRDRGKKHAVQRGQRKKVTRTRNRKKVGYDVTRRGTAWSRRQMRTGKELQRVKTKKSVAERRLKEGEVVAFKVEVRGKECYERREQWTTMVRPEVRPFEGRKRSRVDDKGKRSYRREQVGVVPNRKLYYEGYYRRREEGSTKDRGGRSRAIDRGVQSKEEAVRRRKGRRRPLR
jgi:ribosomal protein L5